MPWVDQELTERLGAERILDAHRKADADELEKVRTQAKELIERMTALANKHCVSRIAHAAAMCWIEDIQAYANEMLGAVAHEMQR